jgi:putative hydrolase of the HAD superfamily
MPTKHFSHVRTWVFDLDHTLYPPDMQLFAQIEVRMANWVMKELGVDRDEANRLRAKYWREHGTTLAGLMRLHDVDPQGYLVDVHDIDFTVLDPDPELRNAISTLPGRKIIYTNGTAPYAENVLKARGLSGEFDAIYGVEHAGFHPKPDYAAFQKVFALDGLSPDTSAMFEDDPRNLKVPHEMGMRTVHVAPDAQPENHIHHHTDDLRGFLTQIT